MSRIKSAFENKKAYIGFLTAGDPSLAMTEEYIVEMARAGAALVEIGIPFSDPIAETATIQESNVRALSTETGCTTDMVFDMVASVSKKVDIPLVLLTYLNPVYKYGYDEFFKKCKETGVDGIIIPDMPYEEKGEVEPFADKYGVDVISLVTLTSKNRIEKIAKEAKGYIYLLASKENVADNSDIIDNIRDTVNEIKKYTDTPVVIDCAISKVEQAVNYSSMADGIIVGNSIVKIIAGHGDDAGKFLYSYVKSIVEEI